MTDGVSAVTILNALKLLSIFSNSLFNTGNEHEIVASVIHDNF